MHFVLLIEVSYGHDNIETECTVRRLTNGDQNSKSYEMRVPCIGFRAGHSKEPGFDG